MKGLRTDKRSRDLCVCATLIMFLCSFAFPRKFLLVGSSPVLERAIAMSSFRCIFSEVFGAYFRSTLYSRFELTRPGHPTWNSEPELLYAWVLRRAWHFVKPCSGMLAVFHKSTLTFIKGKSKEIEIEQWISYLFAARAGPSDS